MGRTLGGKKHERSSEFATVRLLLLAIAALAAVYTGLSVSPAAAAAGFDQEASAEECYDFSSLWNAGLGRVRCPGHGRA